MEEMRGIALVLLLGGCGISIVGSAGKDEGVTPTRDAGTSSPEARDAAPSDARIDGDAQPGAPPGVPPPPDVPPAPVECGLSCASAGGTCVGAECRITGFGGQSVTCPAGTPCVVACGAAGACGPVDCGGSTSCTVNCTAAGACQAIDCVPPQGFSREACAITCSAAGACHGIEAKAASVHVVCSAAGACPNVSCTGESCTIDCLVVGACTSTECCAGTCGGVPPSENCQ